MRSDLLAWTPEALAAEYNPGLVKRAERELLAGPTPELSVEAGDTVVGRFPDGIIVRLPAGVAISRAACSCGATSICRHRLAVVLRYRAVAATAPAPAATAAAGLLADPITAEVQAPAKHSSQKVEAQSEAGQGLGRAQQYGAQRSCAQPRDTAAPPGTGPAQRSDVSESAGPCTKAAPAAEIKAAVKAAEAAADVAAEIDDEMLARELGAAVLAVAQAARARGLMVAVERPPRSEQPTIVRLPTCTVTLRAPGQLQGARCDCAAAGQCAHLALAVWAAREAATRAATDAVPSAGGRSGSFALSGAAPAAPVAPELLCSLEQLADAILERGAAHAEGRFTQRFARLRTQAEAARMTWIVELLGELERLLERYAARSARYHEAELLRFLVELHARARAARQPRELPAAYVLGIGEAAETLLERVRLVSLGARVDVDGKVCRAEVYLADPAAGTVGVIRQSWSYPEDATPEKGPELAQRTVLPRLDLGTLAHGNIVSRAVRRRASCELLLATTTAHTTLLPGSADFSALPPSLLVRRVSELHAQKAAAPPACLRPRLLTEGLIVFAVAEVESVSYAAAEQTAQAIVRDEEGEALVISIAHRAVAPYAVEAFAATLSRGARFVTGQVRWDGDEVSLDAIGVATDAAFVVLDLAPPTACDRLPTRQLARLGSPLAAPLTAAARMLAEVAHHGLLRLPRDFEPRLQQAAQSCADAGLLTLAAKLRQLAQSRTAAAALPAWTEAALYWELLRS